MSQYPYGMPPPAPSDPTDVAWKRVAAWLLDGVIASVIGWIAMLALGLSPTSTTHDFNGSEVDAINFCDAWQKANNGICSHSNGTATTITNYNGTIWIFLGLVVVFIVVQGLLGGSLGKLALGLRIVKKDGSKAGIGASALRTVLWVVDAQIQN